MRTPIDNQSQPLVSIIIPTYNYARFIGEALESVRAQTYTHWECLVVDDGSTDNTAEIIAAYIGREPRIQYLRQQNHFQAAARNHGLRQSKGQYVQFLDADDKIERRKLERQVAYLQQHPEVDIVYGGVQFFKAADGSGQPPAPGSGDTMVGLVKVSGEGLEVLPALVRGNMIAVNSPLVRRSVLEEIGPFDEELPMAEDWDYWLRCAISGLRFQFIDEAETMALVREHTTSSSRNLVRMYRSMGLLREKLGGRLVDESLRARNREGRSAEEGYLGVALASAGQPLRASRHMFKAAVLAHRARWRAKWLLCAMTAPFVSEERLKTMISSPLAGVSKGSSRRKSGEVRTAESSAARGGDAPQPTLKA